MIGQCLAFAQFASALISSCSPVARQPPSPPNHPIVCPQFNARICNIKQASCSCHSYPIYSGELRREARTLRSSPFKSGWFAFLLPSYHTFKALKQRPFSEPEIERLATYWAVVGAFVALEYSGEWLFSWYVFIAPPALILSKTYVRFPFYWELKTVFLLFLSLPQTQVRIQLR